MPITVQKSLVKASFSEALSVVRGGPQSSAFYVGPTPQELHAIYSNGYQGVRPDSTTPKQKTAFKSMLAAQPALYDVFPWAKGIGKGKINLPYLAMLHLWPDWGKKEAQARGDCTVHGTRNSCSVDYGADCLFGETTYKGPLCCENIYRSRGFNGDGWSCEEPCMYVGPTGNGGLLYRQVFKGPDGSTVDLTDYNSSWEGNGRAGVPSWMEEESKKNKVKWVIPIPDMEQYRDAIAIGFGINVCSGQGFSSTTDEFGVAAASGSWSHSMAHAGCIDTDWAHSKYGDMIGKILQDWGDWNTQKGKPEGVAAMVPGSFFAKAAPIASMLRGQDSFAMCSVWGWERTGWEAFDITDHLLDHLRSSTVQDYYRVRYEKSAEHVVKAIDSGMFNIAT